MKTRFWFAYVIVPLLVFPIAVSAGAGEKAKEKPKTKKVKVRDITLEVPKTWKQTPPKSKFRAGQFAIPAAKGDKEDAELIVYFFGSFGGGSVGANVKRWVGQFQSKGRKAKTTIGKSTQGPYVLVNVTGTYNKPIGPPVMRKTKAMSGARMMSVILAVEKKGNYFLKLTGPEKTVTAIAGDFRKSFGANVKEEKEYKPEKKK